LKKEFQLCGLGHAVMDIFLELDESEFLELGFERGTTRLMDLADQNRLLERFHHREPRLVSGGSVANSTIGFSQLGGQAAFIGCVGDDRYGLFYEAEFQELNIDMGNPVIVGETTGTCLCIITPDAERTMRTCLAASGNLAPRHVDEERIKKSEWLFLEGYVFANPLQGRDAIREAVRVATKHGVKIAVTCSEAFVVQAFGDAFFDALKVAELVFCNEAEACAVTKATNAEEAFARLKGMVPSAVVTAGPGGAYVRHGGVEAHVPAFPCKPKDLTGAGDMFAGAFLYGITHGVPPAKAARAGCYLAMKVITQLGARLHHGTKQFWDGALKDSDNLK
jgi:sugar/nucleoside kinase (ribokinase family)